MQAISPLFPWGMRGGRTTDPPWPDQTEPRRCCLLSDLVWESWGKTGTRSQGNCSMFLLLLLPIPHRGPRTTRPRTRKGREEERELRKTPASHSLLSWRKADATEQDAAFYWSNPHASWQAWAAFSIGLQSPLRGELLACPRRTVSRAGVADVRVGPDGGSRCWRECGAEGDRSLRSPRLPGWERSGGGRLPAAPSAPSAPSASLGCCPPLPSHSAPGRTFSAPAL